jgi:hypothetical protein
LERAAAVPLQYPLLKRTPNVLDVPKGGKKIRGIQVWRTTWPGYMSLPSYPSRNIGSLKIISGSVTEMGWGTIMHEPHVSSNIQRDSIQ